MNSSLPTNPDRDEPTLSNRWAPWWLYVTVLLGANYLRAYRMLDSSLPEPINAAIAVGQAALLFVIVTAIWRASRRRSL
jgi:hypothetical protein